MLYPTSIAINQVSKSFGLVTALTRLDLNLEAGKIHGILGPEGAGKTTLLRLISGLLKPDQGTINFCQLSQPLPHAKMRQSIAYMPEKQVLYPELTIQDHLNFFSKLYQLTPSEYQNRLNNLLAITKLGAFLNRPARKLSGGMYKKLGLICVLLRRPQILLLDEPTSGVDPISRRELWELIYTLLEEKILIITTTSYLDEAERCSQIHLLEAGKLIATGEPRELLRQQHAESFAEIFSQPLIKTHVH